MYYAAERNGSLFRTGICTEESAGIYGAMGWNG